MTLVVPAFGLIPPPDAIALAVEALGDGQVIALPTDTVYGLAVDPFRPGATDRLFSAKRRPASVELPVLVDGLESAAALVSSLPGPAHRLIDAYWPGAMTVVVDRGTGASAGLELGGDGATIGLRSPAHPVALGLCRAVGALATSSANLHGEPTPSTAAVLAELFDGVVAVVLDAGPAHGAPSTVVRCGPDGEVTLLREGRIAWDEVRTVATG